MTALLTPLEFGAARQLGATLWRKQLLPMGEINYKGRKIPFDREYLTGLVKAFRDKAYDAVPLQFADHANTHTNDPERRRGTVRDLQLTDDGLDVLVEVTPETAKHLSQYPDLGVSARIVEAYDRADGKFFPAAVQHVLATLDPRIPGMRPWQAIEAANGDDGEVLDLTVTDSTTPDKATAPAAPDAPTAQEEEAGMAFTAEQEARLAKLLSLPEDQFDALISPAAEAEEVTDDDAAADEGGMVLSDEELAALVDEVQADLDAEGDGTDEAGAEDREPAGAALSNEAQTAIEMANARAEEAMAEARRTRRQLDVAAYEKERDHYARKLGIPARITDLARPLLEGSGRTVELANGKHEDAGSIMRKYISAVGETFKQLGMEVELGNSEGAYEDEHAKAEQAESDRGDFVKSYRQQHAL